MGPKDGPIIRFNRWKLVRYTLTAALVAAAVTLTAHQAIRATVASYALKQSLDASAVGTDVTIIRQKIQAHYLRYGVYLPFDDIIITQEPDISEEYVRLLKKNCGKGNIFIWVPIVLKVPLTGEKVTEWCLTMS